MAAIIISMLCVPICTPTMHSMDFIDGTSGAGQGKTRTFPSSLVLGGTSIERMEDSQCIGGRIGERFLSS